MQAGLVKLMESPAPVAGPVNIGNPAEFTMKALAAPVLKECGSSSPLKQHPLPRMIPASASPTSA